MKKLFRLLLFAAALSALAKLPFRSTDAAKLTPVRTVIVTHAGEQYEVDIGAAARGLGRTLAEALDDLRQTVTGALFLPTAEQVIVVDPAGTDSEAVRAVAEESSFCPAAGLYRTGQTDLDAEAVGAYLSSHPSNTTIMQVRGRLAMGEQPRLPALRQENGGYLVEAK